MNQISRELRHTGYAAEVKYVALASRKQTCIHSVVSKFQDTDRLNDACKELVKTEKCTYHNESQFESFADMLPILDIEELVLHGKK